MPTFNDFEAWILCGDKKLDEYCGAVSPDDDKIFICWIPSETGKNFSVHWKLLKSRLASKGEICIDGVQTNTKRANSNGDGCCLGVRTSENMMRPFIFTDMMFTDDETVADDWIDTTEIGQIKLRIFVAKRKFKLRPSTEYVKLEPASLGESYVHESSKKLCIHRVGLGEPTYVPTQARHYRIEYHDKKGVTFIFKYRHRGKPHIMFKPVDRCVLREALLAFLEARGIMQAPAQEDFELCYIATTSSEERKHQPLLHSKNNALGGTHMGIVKSKSKVEEDGEEESIEVLERQLQEVQAKIARKNKRIKVESFIPKLEPTILRADERDVIDLTLD